MSVSTFRQLHRKGQPLVVPNPWDAGSARILQAMGFEALATTSSGFALTLGRKDYRVTQEEALVHAQAVAESVEIPVTADLENGFGARPEDVYETIRRATQIGLAGASIEDATGDASQPLFDLTLAVERITAAVEAARASAEDFVLTARAEAFLYGTPDVDEVVQRLARFAEAGADVLYAPGLSDLSDVRAVCALEKPVNVLVYGALKSKTVDDLATAGAARISIGGQLAFRAYSAAVEAASALLNEGSFEPLTSPSDSIKQVISPLKT
ncbi:MAG: isocitrate lyase/phosphoenolpyruvate mutase family protein [Myxococcota bacterium]